MQPKQTDTQTVQQTEGGGTVTSSDLLACPHCVGDRTAVEIIRHGVPVPPKIPMIAECERCTCVFTFDEQSSERLSNNGGGSVFLHKYPNCGSSCHFDTGYPDTHNSWRFGGEMSENDRLEYLEKQRNADRSVKQRQAKLYALMNTMQANADSSDPRQ